MAIPVPMECGRVRDAVPLTLDVGTVITWRRQIREKRSRAERGFDSVALRIDSANDARDVLGPPTSSSPHRGSVE